MTAAAGSAVLSTPRVAAAEPGEADHLRGVAANERRLDAAAIPPRRRRATAGRRRRSDRAPTGGTVVVRRFRRQPHRLRPAPQSACRRSTSTASATPANKAASSGLSTIAGDAPAASSALATKLAGNHVGQALHQRGRRARSAACAATMSATAGACAADGATGIENSPEFVSRERFRDQRINSIEPVERKPKRGGERRFPAAFPRSRGLAEPSIPRPDETGWRTALIRLRPAAQRLDRAAAALLVETALLRGERRARRAARLRRAPALSRSTRRGGRARPRGCAAGWKSAGRR